MGRRGVRSGYGIWGWGKGGGDSVYGVRGGEKGVGKLYVE